MIFHQIPQIKTKKSKIMTVAKKKEKLEKFAIQNL
jgi:hypothetical protein